MGLLGYIVSHGLDKPRGLLECACRVLQEGAGEFDEVCSALGASHAALLTMRGGVFRAAHAFGLDAETLVSSVSSADWWAGMLNGRDARKFDKSDGTLAGCYQLLSSRFKDSVTSVLAVEVMPSAVFLCVVLEGESAMLSLGEAAEIKRVMQSFIKKRNADGSEEALDDALLSRFNLALEMGDAVLCRLEVARAVEETIADIAPKDTMGGVMCDVREALYEELLQMIRRSFPPPAYCADNKDGTIRLVLFVNEDFDQDLALFHIQKHLERVLGELSGEVDLLDALKAANTDEIMAFVG